MASVTARAGVRLPEDQEWNRQVAWLFVGGDILGRGQTLVNLMTDLHAPHGGDGCHRHHSAARPLLRLSRRVSPLLRGWFEPDMLRPLSCTLQAAKENLLSSLSDLGPQRFPPV